MPKIIQKNIKMFHVKHLFYITYAHRKRFKTAKLCFLAFVGDFKAIYLDLLQYFLGFLNYHSILSAFHTIYFLQISILEHLFLANKHSGAFVDLLCKVQTL